MAIIKHKLTQCSAFALNCIRQKTVDVPLCLVLHLFLESHSASSCHSADSEWVYFSCTKYDIIGKKNFWVLLHGSVVNLITWSSELWLAKVPVTMIQPWVTLHLTLTQIPHVF